MSAVTACAFAPKLASPRFSNSSSGSRGGRRGASTVSLRSVVRVRAADESNAEPERAPGPSTNQMLVFVPPHPLINHWLAIARNVQTPPPIFRSTLGELGRLLIYEAARDWLPTFSAEVQGPVGLAKVEMVDPSQPIACLLYTSDAADE